MDEPEDGVPVRLGEALRASDITQSKLAELVGTSQPAVSQWLRGLKSPTSENLKLLARVLSVRLEWLQIGEGRMRERDVAAERAAYREAALWGFREAPPDGGRDYGNANVWSF